MLPSNWSSKFLTFPIPFLNFFSYCSMFWYISSVLSISLLLWFFISANHINIYIYFFEIHILKFIFQLLCDSCSFLLNIILLFHDYNIFSKNIDSLDFLFSLQILVLSKFFSSVDLVLLFMLDAFFHVSR